MTADASRPRRSGVSIGDLALLGDLHTAALVGKDGSIVWLCLPRFDSGACFASLLHDQTAGYWSIAPDDAEAQSERSYRGETLVLETRWRTAEGSARVTDFMQPRARHAAVIRIVEGIEGTVRMRSTLRLRFDYGRVRPWLQTRSGSNGPGLEAVAGPDAVLLRCDTPLRVDADGDVTSQFTVSAGQQLSFVMSHRPSFEDRGSLPAPSEALENTLAFWRDWIARCSYSGGWQAEVRRSLILLKALTYAPTGGIVAAATTSLPEDPGGVRNWDYRYCWLRDSTFTLQALLGAGYTDEAKAWREWLLRSVAGDPADLQIMYGLDGTQRLPELELDWLTGYANSRPVRVGNAAAQQRQLDVWGETLDGLSLARAAGLQSVESAWELQKGLVDWLEGNWRKPDNGLWEMRGGRHDFVHSKVMAWAGVDRAVRAVEDYGLEGPVGPWRKLAAEIHHEVCEKGYDADRGTFTQFYGSKGLDASLLLMPRVGFLPWTDDRVVGTVRAVERELLSNGYLRRYDPDADGGGDGLSGHEGAFVACSFWLADALHGIGDTASATELFQRLLTLRNDVGMMSEEHDTHTGQALGNTPQAFSLVGLVNTARHLSSETPSDSRHAPHGGG